MDTITEQPFSTYQESRPVPDPTLLTMQLVDRELNGLRELLMMRINGLEVERSTLHTIFAEELRKIPFLIEKSTTQIRELLVNIMDERFNGVEKQFKERDVRTEQTARDTKVAVDAALQAAEKAVNKQNESFALSIEKSEEATIKQIDQQGRLLETATKASNDKIDDLKERVLLIEGRTIGLSGAHLNFRDGLTIAAGG